MEDKGFNIMIISIMLLIISTVVIFIVLCANMVQDHNCTIGKTTENCERWSE